VGGHAATNDATAKNEEEARVKEIVTWDIQHNLKTDWLYIRHHFTEDRHDVIEAIHEDIICQIGNESDQPDDFSNLTRTLYRRGRTMNLSMSTILEARDTLNGVQNAELKRIEVHNKILTETVRTQEGVIHQLYIENGKLQTSLDERQV
jgi:hypothetical protein